MNSIQSLSESCVASLKAPSWPSEAGGGIPGQHCFPLTFSWCCFPLGFLRVPVKGEYLKCLHLGGTFSLALSCLLYYYFCLVCHWVLFRMKKYMCRHKTLYILLDHKGSCQIPHHRVCFFVVAFFSLSEYWNAVISHYLKQLCFWAQLPPCSVLFLRK